MSKIMYLSLSLFLLPLLSIAEELNLSANGKTDYQIVIPDQADARNNYAAKQLKKYLNKITKADFKITKLAEATSSKKIYVGLTKDMRNLLSEVDFKPDYSSRIIIKTKGSDLFITGTQSGGTLLAVYSFLEDYLGCRWLTARTSVVPRNKDLKIADINLDYTPPFKDVRLVYYVGSRLNYVYSARLRLKTLSFYEKPIHKVLNKTFNTWPPYHSSFIMIPPKKYFPTHPEWFSFNREKRTKDNQLCFGSDTNGLAREMFKNAKSYLDKNPSGTLMVPLRTACSPTRREKRLRTRISQAGSKQLGLHWGFTWLSKLLMTSSSFEKSQLLARVGATIRCKSILTPWPMHVHVYTTAMTRTITIMQFILMGEVKRRMSIVKKPQTHNWDWPLRHLKITRSLRTFRSHSNAHPTATSTKSSSRLSICCRYSLRKDLLLVLACSLTTAMSVTTLWVWQGTVILNPP